MIAFIDEGGNFKRRRAPSSFDAKKHLIELRLCAVELKNAVRRIEDAMARLPDGSQAKADLRASLQPIGMALGEIEREIQFEEGNKK